MPLFFELCEEASQLASETQIKSVSQVPLRRHSKSTFLKKASDICYVMVIIFQA